MLKLKELREKKGVTQQVVADLLNITRAAYTNIENGKREADYKTLFTLADYFGTTIDYMLGNTDDSENIKNEPAGYEVGSVEWLRRGLIYRGIIKEGEDLTDEQLGIALANLDSLAKILSERK